MKAFTFILIFIFISKFNYSQWISKNTNTSSSLWSIDFSDNDIGWIAGDDNNLLNTNDGGQSWELYSRYTTPASNYVWNSVIIVNNESIYACGKKYNNDRFQSNWIYTTDGGSNWKGQTSWGSSFSRWMDAQFIDENIGWRVGVSGGNGRCYKTTGGVSGTWELNFNADDGFNKIYFVNENEGWICGEDGIIYHSIDNGENWTLQQSNTTKSLKSIYFIDNAMGWCVGHDDEGAILLKTTDGGESWIEISVLGTLDLNSIFFTDANVGWTCGSVVYAQEERGVILYSEDGGENWSIQHVQDSLSVFHDIKFIDMLNGWVVGTDGILLATSNGGITDVQIDPKTEKYSISQNYPNPFNPTTTIKYSIPSGSTEYYSVLQNVELKVYDILGREVSTLVDQKQKPGHYDVEFNGSEFTSGIYLYRLSVGHFAQTKKMILIK